MATPRVIQTESELPASNDGKIYCIHGKMYVWNDVEWIIAGGVISDPPPGPDNYPVVNLYVKNNRLVVSYDEP